MLDPEIRLKNTQIMTKEDLDKYFDNTVREIDEYVYGGEGADRKDFMFDAMSMISWKNALDIIGVETTPFQPIAKIQSTKVEKQKMKEMGRLCRQIIDKQRKAGQCVFVRSDVGVASETLLQFSRDFRYPGLTKGFTAYDRVNVDDSLRIAQFMSPNPEYIFLMQFFYVNTMYYSYNVENSEILHGPDEHKAFVQNIIDKLGNLHIRPRHPQYIEHGTRDISFKMTVVDAPNGPEVFSASAFDLRVGKPMYLVNKL
ncbi:hypothetical protein EVB55_176 [Rhizobium phage RHph_Y68]|uniref:Uncharacterized protein n=1 Tax=Rhizobium phage RHph_Y68 TaxID=2509787 RepID=A0A7S5QY89_9CAUD|nr:hypothetical protein PP934_gp176 [Rhizobium phage RHph_Y68]QIG68111.1 hypothetical protein EVB55_176 [Rhizobium phage RHph_Y68]